MILLLFGIGLRFHLRELIAVWRLAVPGALIQSTLSTSALAVLLHFMGWDWASGFILGMAISVASTVVMAMVLTEWHDLHAKIGHIAIGWTVVEDILTVALLLLLPIIFSPDRSMDQNIGAVLGLAGIKIVGLLAIVVVLGKWIIPWALERIAKTRSRELFTLAVLVLAVGIAVGSAKLLAFRWPLVLFLPVWPWGVPRFAARAGIDALPMRDAFAVLFFVSVGMLFDPLSLIQVPFVIATVLLVVVHYQAACRRFDGSDAWPASGCGYPHRSRLFAGWRIQFYSRTVALQLKIINDAGWNALVAASIILHALNPYSTAGLAVYPQNKKALPVVKSQPSTIDSIAASSLLRPIGQIVLQIF